MKWIGVPATTPPINRKDLWNDVRNKLEMVRLYTQFFRELEEKIYADKNVILLIKELHSKRPDLFQSWSKGSNEDNEPEAVAEDILKPLYRKMAMKLHPDRKWWDQELFKEVKDAYEQWEVDKLVTMAEKIWVAIGDVWVNQEQLQKQLHVLEYNLFNISIFWLRFVEIIGMFYGEDLNDNNFDRLFERVYEILLNKTKLRIVEKLGQ